MKTCLMCRKNTIEHYGICKECAELNRNMRDLPCHFEGKTAVVTGGRIKIGYAVCLRLLRNGAKVIAVTRYPKTAMEQYAGEPDFEQFKDRLFIIGFDLLRVDLLSELLWQIQTITENQVDILINNAAQTVKKSNEYYAMLTTHENQLLLENSNHLVLYQNQNDTMHTLMSFGVVCEYGETSLENSWVRKAENISVKEMLEVQLINVTAPFLLTSGIRKMMLHSPSENKFIINVSSVEGRFHTKQKLARHVHTNMAKASLNMMTHSVASDFAKDNIYVYSCDPGWVSNQFPPEYEISKNFQPYLTFEDAACRILYPIVKNSGERKITDFGKFYKDYQIIDY